MRTFYEGLLGRLDVLSDWGRARSRGLAIYGFFHAENGLGKAARSLATAFETTGLPTSSHSLKSGHTRNEINFPCSEDCTNKLDVALLAINANAILPENLQGLMNPAHLRHNRRIGLFFWELPVFPGMWTRAIDSLDEIWVPTTFVANSLKTATAKTVRVVPLPVPINDIDQKSAREMLGLPSDVLIFLTVFDFSSYPERKNPLGVINAFVDAFPQSGVSSPLLVVKCHGSHFRGGYEQQLRAKCAENPNIILMDEVLSEPDVLKLQAAADVFVSLHRSEGFGLNLAECMAAGKLVIGTNFSGNIDFMNEANRLVVDFDMRRVADGEYIAGEGQWWADPKHESAVESFRRAANETNIRTKLGAAAKADVRQYLSYQRVGSLMAEGLDELRNSGGSVRVSR